MPLRSIRHERRLTLAGLTAALLVASSACGDPAAGPGGGPPTTSEPSSTPFADPPTTTPPDNDDDALTIDTLAPDELVLRVGRAGSNGDDEPRLVSLYADGTVIVPRNDSPTGSSSFRIDDARMTELLGLASAARLYDDGVDYGEIDVTDIGSTVVTAGTDRGTAEVSVWALEIIDEMSTDLSDDQVAARDHLRELVEALEATQEAPARDATLEPYVPATLQLRLSPVDPDDEAVPTADWPLDGMRAGQWRVTRRLAACLPVTRNEVGPLLAKGQVQEWSLPRHDGAAPPTVRVHIEAVQPADEPCDGAPAFAAPRPLTADEARSTTSRVQTPWPSDAVTTVHPLEAWAAAWVLLTEVLPAELPGGGDWDSTRWSWFDVGVVGVELDGRRFVDVMATCTVFVEDEESACTILARFDATTGALVELSAS